jgi:hypothetical protein
MKTGRVYRFPREHPLLSMKKNLKRKSEENTLVTSSRPINNKLNPEI